MRWWLVLAVVACKREPAPAVFGVVGEVPGRATLVGGAHGFALRAGDRWYASNLVEDVAIGAAVAREATALGGVVDVFFGTTPIVVGGEEHHERHVRIPHADVALDGVASEVAVTGDGVELWAYTHELEQRLAVVRGTTVSTIPQLPRLGAIPASMSPVSARLCKVPRVVDVAAAEHTGFALVTECNEDAPLRLVDIAGAVTTLPSRAQLGISGEQLAIARDGTPVLAGVRGGKLAIVRGGTTSMKPVDATRVRAIVIADDGTPWTFALDAHGVSVVVRGDAPVVLAAGHTAVALARDARLGVVVLAHAGDRSVVYAERP